ASGAAPVAVPFGDDVAHQAVRPGFPHFAQAFLPASRLFRPARTLAEPQFRSLAEHGGRGVRGVHHDTRRTLGFGACDDTFSAVLPPGAAQPPHRRPGQKDDYATAKQKFDSIEAGSLRSGTRVVLTIPELNAWVAREAPAGVRNTQLRVAERALATGAALINFDKLERSTGRQPGWLMSK